MYSGTAFSNLSGNLLGVHQKINRTAFSALAQVTSIERFPSKRQINHFEGKNGPDGIKAKSPSQDEPWHYYDPYDPDDTQLLEIIDDHYQKLVLMLKHKNRERASFEAAWLSHAIVDGLTPAHHYPYEEEIERLFGASKETRNTIRKKIIISAPTKTESIKRNWQMWGAKGLFTTHALFEMGVAMILLPQPIRGRKLAEEDITKAKQLGISEMFMRSARRIAGEFAYDEFIRRGWTPALARWVKNDLAPEIANVVALAWYCALKEAGMANKP